MKYLLIALVIALVGIGFWKYQNNEISLEKIKSIAVPDVEITEPNFKAELVESPLRLRGSAKGTWYFEGSFPMHIEDGSGNVLGNGVAQAEGDWMTTDKVPFSGEIIFSPSKSSTGFIVLEKDNPSGLPENDKSIRIPITFN